MLPLIVIAIAAAGGTFATTGRLMRWLPEAGPRRRAGRRLAIAALCIAGDLTMIGVRTSETPASRLAVIAVAASLTRIAVCASTMQRRIRVPHRQNGHLPSRWREDGTLSSTGRTQTPVVVYSRPGCPYCFLPRRALRRRRLAVTEINIWEDPAAAAAVRAVADGTRPCRPCTSPDDGWSTRAQPRSRQLARQ